MKPTMFGAAVASIAAPYLSMVFSWTIYAIQSDKDILALLLEFPGTLVAGTVGALLFGLPLFLVSLLLASSLRNRRAGTWWAAMMLGGSVGFCFSLWLYKDWRNPEPAMLVFMHLPNVLSGIISGWICWFIMMRERQHTSAD